MTTAGQGMPRDAGVGQVTPERTSAFGRWRIQARMQPSVAWRAASIFAALLGAFVLSALLIASAHVNVRTALGVMVQGAFGSRSAVIETLVQATPFILTGLAVTVAFRGRIFNIGAEGQFFAGAMAAYWLATVLRGAPQLVMLPALLLAGCAGGALWGFIPGVLKARYGASEIIVTVMLNFVIALVLSFLLANAWREPTSYFYQTALMPDASYLPRLVSGGRLHLGFPLALVVAALVWVLLWKTTLGYEIRAMGINSLAARYKGISVAATTILVLVISGAIAGLAGVGELTGIHHRLRLDISVGYGFAGIIIALLGQLHPVGVVLAAIFLGALLNGASAMQIVTGVPVALVNAIEGITLLCLLIAEVLARYEIRRTVGND
jgi:ABC-type uncharacterized transport system permease subunit